ncbi:MAG: hypothetical protein FIB00_16265 [Chloroflexi bacterium]|nr:hypothetical protein [Chloroflexota bacterium]
MSWKSAAFLSGAVFCLAGCGSKGLPEPAAPQPDRTGAVSSINTSQIPSGSLTLQDLLRGKASGLEFITQGDGSQRIQIRGMASINPSQNPEPLILVDGIEIPANQLSTALAALTRDDIRKVDVLKDIASTSSYGMRAAGGVILITTSRR